MLRSVLRYSLYVSLCR